jgi:CRISPR-associated endoribonuclease Cas6
MRLKMIFLLKKPELDIEYHRAFLSLLKKSFQETFTKVFQKLYGTGTKMKPFTFRVFMPQPKFSEKTIALGSKEITLNFSTYYSELGIYFYRSLVKKRKRFKAYPLPGDNSLRLKRVHLIKEKPIKSTEAVFKTLSPFLVRLHHKETNQDDYITWNHNLFVPQNGGDRGLTGCLRIQILGVSVK